jgi:hypothetical protein
MKIPTFLNATYSNDLKLNAFVSHALSQIEAHIEANKPIFFPEYTDHSLKHIELTLQTAFDLASPAARGLLTTIDAGALAVGISLHDLGIYLTKDGFDSLISEDSRWKGVEFFDRMSWKVLWEEFYGEATRFDGRKLRQLFGDKYRPVRPIPPKGSAWEDLDYLLVGEFIRRHHPRLAHEMALYGLPAKDGNAIEICPTKTEDQAFLADVSGLVARSHGIELRTCVDYLQHKYKNRIDPRGSHPIYLAALLRIADYFQIQSARAPSARTEVASFQSSLSEREWTVHQSVKDINNTGGDPEAIVIIAEPGDVEVFLKVKSWITGLQRELDQTWAILGEVYGLQVHTGLNLLGLKIRRVKSNIDDVVEFSKTVTYIPEKIAFEAANADLLKLLVAPLYGDDPSFGVRELIQNAIDAVREYDDSALKHELQIDKNRFSQNADVVLLIETDKEANPISLTITDRGIGMTPNVVRDYFLKAGASLRKSNAWRKEHEDSSGRSEILRTGRFGVGALAAFLIGDEIEVTTRNAFAPSSNGIAFKARLDDDAISLDRVECPVGTSIRISIPDRVKTRLRALLPAPSAKHIGFGSGIGHYFLKRPSLERTISNRPEIPVESYLPLPDDDVSEVWRCFSNSDFERVFWTFSPGQPSVSCNGIIIQAGRPHDRLEREIKNPSISVFDKDGLLPVNLERKSLQGALPFKEDLIRSIADDLLVFGLLEAPDQPFDGWFHKGVYEGFRDGSFYAGYNQIDWSRWLITKDGFMLNARSLVQEFQAEDVISIIGGPMDNSSCVKTFRTWLPATAVIASYLPTVHNDLNPRIKGIFAEAMSGRIYPPSVSMATYSTYVPQILIDKIARMHPGKNVSRLLKSLNESPSENGWRGFPAGALGKEARFSKVALATIDPDNPAIVCAGALRISETLIEDIIGKRWIELLGTAVIPFRESDRQKLVEKVRQYLPTLVQIREEIAAKKRKKVKEKAKK